MNKKVEELATQIKDLHKFDRNKIIDQLALNYVGFSGKPSQEFENFQILKMANSENRMFIAV